MEQYITTSKKNSWYGKIETEDEALKVIKDASYGFFFLAVLQGVIGIVLGMDIWLDAILYLIFAAILLKFKSRIVAVLLLLLTGAALFFTFLNRIGPDPSGKSGGTNIFLALIMFWAAVRAIQATFKLRKIKQVSKTNLNIVS